MNKSAKQLISISQISVLIIGIFAFGFLISGVERVRGAGEIDYFSNIPDKLALDSSVVDKSYTGPSALVNPTSSVVTGKTPEFVSIEYFFKGTGGFSYTRVFFQSASWALIAYGAVAMVGGLLGMDKEKTSAIGMAAAVGFGAGRAAWALSGMDVLKGKTILGMDKLGTFGANQFGVGLTVGLISVAIVLYMTYKTTEEETIEFTCDSWEAPTGGASCEECNKQGVLPCSEYQCRSLGQACEIVNAGTTDEKCVWINPHDVIFPTIEPWTNALSEDYKYTPDNTISPPDRGVKIEHKTSTTKCVKAFTPLTFGITTNEPAKCKIDYLRKAKFDEMSFWFGGTQLFLQNHTQIMSLPGKSAYDAENIMMNNNGNYELFVRCQDKNGNYNTAHFVFKFCVEAGPDTTAPAIITTNLINGMPIGYNQSSVNLIAYINEPSECKWSHLDKEYKDMEKTMTCSKSVTEMNAQMLYECKTTLDGLKNNEENKFYFRCKDQPTGIAEENRNINTESYEFILKGTIPLVMNKIGPNGTVKDSTDPVKITLNSETSAGAQEGKSTCYYSNNGEQDSFVEFFNTNSNKHSQELFLAEGNYNYYIKCIDLGGNSVQNITKFKVESDAEAPNVVRAYHEETNLKLTTDEEATCVYDIKSCNYLFDDGVALTSLSGTNHFTEWDTNKNFYVKCKDVYGNQPIPSQCSIIVRPFELYGKKI